MQNKKTKFKETEIGKIPEDWKVGTLKDIANFKNGKSSPERGDEKDFFVYGSNGIIGKSDKTNSDEETIIIGRVGSYCGSVYFSKNKCWVTDNAIIGKAKENSESSFLFYILKRLKLNNRRSGSGQPLLNQSILYSIKIPLIGKAEQTSIAKTLSDLDSKIELLQKQNQTLEKIGQALFKHWFVDFEFPNEKSKPYKSSGGEMVDSELGNIPKGWEVGKVGDLILNQGGFAFKSKDFVNEGEIGVIKIKNIFGGVVDIKNTQFVVGDIIKNLDSKFKIDSGSILIAMTGAEVAKIGIIPKTNKELWLNQRVGMFKEKIKGGLFYSYILLSSQKYQDLMKNKAYGSAQPNISSSDIENIKIIVPSKQVVENFGSFFNNLFKKDINNLFDIEILSQTRDKLLPPLMSGKIRVPVEVRN
jgi:type I restriction enzyme, S subunit